jgi:hypothetical protein
VVISWAEDEYVLPPREQLCEFEFPEDIVVPNLPEQEAGNQEEGLPAPENPGDFERGRKWTRWRHPPPEIEHSMPPVEEQSSALVGPEKESEDQDTEGPSVQEKESEDSKFGGAPESVPR